jgi:hypothetical protein
MRREEGDRLRMIAQTPHPEAPDYDAPPHQAEQHAMHLALCWIMELTDLPVDVLYNYFAWQDSRGRYVSPGRLDAAARILLRVLHTHSDHFSAAVYASLYEHASKGLVE